MLSVLIWLSILSTALMAGLYFAFSTFVMQALGTIGGSGAEAMIAINRVILRSPFLPVFLGSTALTLGLSVFALTRLSEGYAIPLFAAGAVYVVGMVAVTMLFNVPLNNRLDAGGAGDLATWRHYLTSWTNWNHVRTVASFASLALYVVTLTRLPPPGA